MRLQAVVTVATLLLLLSVERCSSWTKVLEGETLATLDWVASCTTCSTVVEGDIAVRPVDKDNEYYNPTGEIKLWDNGIVPYTFTRWWSMSGGEMSSSENYQEEEKKVIRDSMDYITKNVPCIKFREVKEFANGSKLIFYPFGSEACWGYLGDVGYPDDRIVTAQKGQQMKVDQSCMDVGSIVHLLMHSLGLTHDQISKDIRSKSGVSTRELLELARLYEEVTPGQSCYKDDNIKENFNVILEEVNSLSKSCKKGGYYLYLSDSHILELPSFKKAKCHIDPYPYHVNYGGMNAVSAVVDNMLHICGGTEPSCYALNGTKWVKKASLSESRERAGSSMFRGNWFVTGGTKHNTQYSSTEVFSGGSWVPGPSMDTSTFWSSSGLTGTGGHCQVTVGSEVILAGGYTDRGRHTKQTFSWDGNSWTELGEMEKERVSHACVELNGYVYAIGGEWDAYQDNSIEKLDLHTGKWSEGPKLPQPEPSSLFRKPLSNVSAVKIFGELYIVGGLGDNGGKVYKLVGDTFELVANTGLNGYRHVGHTPSILTGDQIVCD